MREMLAEIQSGEFAASGSSRTRPAVRSTTPSSARPEELIEQVAKSCAHDELDRRGGLDLDV